MRNKLLIIGWGYVAKALSQNLKDYEIVATSRNRLSLENMGAKTNILTSFLYGCQTSRGNIYQEIGVLEMCVILVSLEEA